jgi:hypothetical protein
VFEGTSGVDGNIDGEHSRNGVDGKVDEERSCNCVMESSMKSVAVMA